MKEFQISYVYEGEEREYHQVLSANDKRDAERRFNMDRDAERRFNMDRDAERRFNMDLIDASEDVPEKATITRILDITDRAGRFATL